MLDLLCLRTSPSAQRACSGCGCHYTRSPSEICVFVYVTHDVMLIPHVGMVSNYAPVSSLSPSALTYPKTSLA
jgi:hypothetical protein